LLAAGRREAGIRALERAASGLETLRLAQASPSARMGLVAAHRTAHDFLVEALRARGKPEEAWAVSARLKARELAAQSGASARPGPSSTAKLEAAFLRLVAAPKTALKTRRLVAIRRRYLDQSDGELGASAGPSAGRGGVSSAALAARLGPRTAIIEYHVGERLTQVFAVDARGCRALSVAIGERELGRAVDRLLAPLREATTTSDARAALLAFDLDLATHLCRAILAPVLAALSAAVDRLIIVSEGPLAGLPFELLALGRDRPDPDLPALAAFGHAVYLGDRYAVSYAASSAFLVARARPPVPGPPRSLYALAYSPPHATAVATPAGLHRVAPLPGAGQEVVAIAPLFARSHLSRGRGATAAAYAARAGRFDVVHLAAHALADLGAPGLSGLVLAPAQRGEAGYLSADSIRRLPLRAGLVTLSACDTGRGRLRAREGVLGLARAFLEAGADAVLASLWPVDDRAARDLMTAFYRRLVAGLPRAAALAAAKREQRRAYGRHLYPERAHPYFWAAFVLTDHRPDDPVLALRPAGRSPLGHRPRPG